MTQEERRRAARDNRWALAGLLTWLAVTVACLDALRFALAAAMW